MNQAFTLYVSPLSVGSSSKAGVTVTTESPSYPCTLGNPPLTVLFSLSIIMKLPARFSMNSFEAKPVGVDVPT